MAISVGRASASIASAVAENTIALSNINFDFSLVKVEAPAELLPLRGILSRKRVETAEHGSLHILARRLGALFDGLVGDTPHLRKAYGARASEIALAASAGQKQPPSYGIFADQVGVDGATIWAAATSGKNALRMHLLACMLARLWTAQEATAIWVELVGERQSILKKEMEEEGGHIMNLAQAAALTPIDELQLSEWDASARAWLQTADEVYKLKQTQLMLIVNNVSLAVDVKNQRPYSSVIEVWGNAMRIFEEVVQGSGRRVSSGALLLGLSAWHIYPDMVVLGQKTTNIFQKDSLVKQGGIVTIGLSGDACGAADLEEGIYWSLPLASLRYYGDAVEICRSSMSDATRLSISQLQQVALGAALAEWGGKVSHLEAANIILTVLEHLESRFISGVRISNLQGSWSCGAYIVVLEKIGLFALKGIGEGAKALAQEDPTGCKEVTKLVAYGSRHGTNWLASQLDPGRTSIPPCFGLNDPGYIISFIIDLETRLDILRTLCEGYGVADSSTIIRYWVGPMGSLASHFEFATTTRPPPFSRSKRDAEGSVKPTAQPATRFVHIPVGNEGFLQYRSDACKEQFAEASIEWVFLEDVQICDARHAPVGSVRPCKLLFGHPRLGAVYRVQIGERKGRRAIYKLDPGTLSMLLQHKSFDQKGFITSFGNMFGAGHGSQIGRSLSVLAMASEFYNRCLPSSTVSLTILTKPLYNSFWSRDILTHLDTPPQATPPQASPPDEQPRRLFPPMSRAAMFSLILYFESGTISIPEKSLQGVMAISCGNSVFVAGHLLADPAETLPSDSVQRITGNIGRPGIALLIPPEKPRIRKTELDKWKMIEHAAFDGTRPVGRFEGTSVQLSFTGYELGVDTGRHGLRGRAAFFSETRVSVHHQGVWVADVDLLGGIESRQLHQECTGHTHSDVSSEGVMTYGPAFSLEDIFDIPLDLGSPFLAFQGDMASSSTYNWGEIVHPPTRSGGSSRRESRDVTLGQTPIPTNTWEVFPDLATGSGSPCQGDAACSSAFNMLDMFHQHTSSTHSSGSPKEDMTRISIDNWEEILDPPKGLGVVRATGDWIARLSAVAIATQMGYLCLVVPGDSPICWDCIRCSARVRGKQEDRIILVI